MWASRRMRLRGARFGPAGQNRAIFPNSGDFSKPWRSFQTPAILPDLGDPSEPPRPRRNWANWPESTGPYEPRDLGESDRLDRPAVNDDVSPREVLGGRRSYENDERCDLLGLGYAPRSDAECGGHR